MAAFVTPLVSSAFLPSKPISKTSIISTTPNKTPRNPPVAVAEPLPPPTRETFDTYVMNTYTRYPLTMSHGQGATLYTTENDKFIDCVAGIATCTLGHAHPAIVKAVSEQIRQVCHVSNLYYIPRQGELAKWLVESSGLDRAFFCNSGTEANEAAIKLARKNWHRKKGLGKEGRPVILSAKQSFHGRTLAALSATGQEKYQNEYWPLVEGFEYFAYNDVDDLQRVAEGVKGRLAGIMLEAIQGEGGVNVGSKEMFKKAREICDDEGALLIFDEVQVGVGRTGTMWGFEQTGVVPDVFTLAKGLGGGVPIGAMVCRKWCDLFQPGDHASTFGGNPLAAAAGLATVKELESGVLENCQRVGKVLENGLRGIMERVKCVKEIRGRGLIWGVEIDGQAGVVVKRMLEKGVLLVPAGANVVRFVPPLVITKEEVETALAKFEDALNELQNEKLL